MAPTVILPADWGRPQGMSHALAYKGRQPLFISGQLGGATGADAPAPGTSMAKQFVSCLANVISVVKAANGVPEDIAALRVFVTDIDAFKGAQTEIAVSWRQLFGKHFPAITMVEVLALYDEAALVEIEATAMLEDEVNS
jgi:enamine deaminase RidA (YjgF/YER057c/UK114 family)